MATMAQTPPRPWAMPVRADWLAAAALALAALATRAIWFGDPVADFDEQIYSLFGWRMTHGDLPPETAMTKRPRAATAARASAAMTAAARRAAASASGRISTFKAVLSTLMRPSPSGPDRGG